jgi:hypothetical protein
MSQLPEGRRLPSQQVLQRKSWLERRSVRFPRQAIIAAARKQLFYNLFVPACEYHEGRHQSHRQERRTSTEKISALLLCLVATWDHHNMLIAY